ncbi:D-ribitol-5-phosphate cytidylyltransferase-like [Panonychus citri]|uniref:D-ribitol-5-phosphate cytidylyltransferase-like n=1 Tax=Panonychus citri TaxID=50023 RepID=UPI002306EB12|nr:D-ribitol-5-phosphate cytidylyltransferase-like [Panonychus citri]XP_053201831.1 D-ribitol-5-phosphate cytidylyltransferase-like [Panonychus citri]
MSIGIIIPAAGSGSRFDNSPPKQFVKVDGLPLLYYTISTFVKLSSTVLRNGLTIVVVCPERYVSLVREEILSYFSNQVEKGSLTVILGCDSRHRSINTALNYLHKRPDRPELVIIHDGVRPMVDTNLLSQLIEMAKENGAAGPICDLVSTTLKIDSENFISDVLYRDLYKQSEMPQVFRYEVIKKGYDDATDFDLDNGTECMDLVRKYTNVKTKVVRGSPSNLFKVTFKKDLYAIEGMLKEIRTIKLIPMSSSVDDDFLFIEAVEKELKKRFKKILIETYRNGRNQSAPNESLVFFWFLENWSAFKNEEKSINNRQKYSSWAHVIFLHQELDESEYCDVVRYTKSSTDNYILGSKKSDPSKLTNFLATMLWNHDHFSGYVHFL